MSAARDAVMPPRATSAAIRDKRHERRHFRRHAAVEIRRLLHITAEDTRTNTVGRTTITRRYIAAAGPVFHAFSDFPFRLLRFAGAIFAADAVCRAMPYY